MGGRVGLKGTDGPDIVEKARKLGAVPESHRRAADALRRLLPLKNDFKIYTYPFEMGGDTAVSCGFVPIVIGAIESGNTTAEDTREAAREYAAAGVDLLMFAGGDGTARDIYHAVGGEIVVLGIPTGVKMHSAVYACNPMRAGDLAAMMLLDQIGRFKDAEVMDIDEEQYRQGVVTAKLYGYLRIPFERHHLQGLKSGSPANERFMQEAAAQDIIDSMEKDCHYVIGPGTTTAAIMRRLNLDYSLLGVDVIYQNKLVGKDLSEQQLSECLLNKKFMIIVTPIGGQGYLFGRGNQQISPDIIRQAGRDGIMVIATKDKINSLRGRHFLVDTGDATVDNMLCGYYAVVTGYRERVVYRVMS